MSVGTGNYYEIALEQDIFTSIYVVMFQLHVTVTRKVLTAERKRNLCY